MLSIRKAIKYGFALSLAVCSSNAVHAQSLKYGITAGVSYSKPEGYKGFTGFKVGGVATYEFSDEARLTPFVQGELKYSQLGLKEDIYFAGGEISTATYRSRLHYIEMPLTAGLRWHTNESQALFVKAGLILRYGVGENAKVSGLPYDTSGFTLFDDGYYNRFEAAGTVGLGFDFSKHFQLSATRDFCFGHLKNKGSNSIFPHRNREWTVNGTYFF